MRHRHTTPFEMVEFKFHCKMPIFVARQWVRHRTANINEYSLRYSEARDDFYFPNRIIEQFKRLLNVKLLERTKRTVFLTPLGKEISKKAESINIEMNDVLDLVKSAQEKMFGETKLGVIPTIAPYLLPKLMPKIRKHYPGLNLKLVEDQTANILSMLYSGSLDLILIAKPYKTENLNVELIKKDFFHVALPFNSNL